MFQNDEGATQKGIGAGESVQNLSEILSKLGQTIPLIGQLSSQLSGELGTVMKYYEKTITDAQTKFFGGGREYAENIRGALTSGADGIIMMGGKLSDVQDIMGDISSTLQTNFVAQGEIYSQIYASAQLTAGSTKEAGIQAHKLIGDFKTLGYSLFDISEKTAGIVNLTRSMGVNTNAVYDQINKNVSVLNTYNFSEGIQGMAKMAANATMLRIDMKTSLDFAEKLFNPEKAIEMAAGFQRLGVQVTDLLDPLRMMDLSLNDPAKLQEGIIEMTKSLTYFDEKNQRIAILPGEQRRLRELADVMGISTQELAKMAINAGELEEKFKRFEVPEFVPEDQRDEVKTLIANLGQLKDGKLVVSIPGTDKLVEASELTSGDIEKLQKQAVDQNKTMEQLQMDTNNKLDQLNNYMRAIIGQGFRAVAGSEDIAKITDAFGSKGIDVLDQIMEINSMISGDKRFEEKQFSSALRDIIDELIPDNFSENIEQIQLPTQITSQIDLLRQGQLGVAERQALQTSVDTFIQSLQNPEQLIEVRDFIKFPGEKVKPLEEDTLFGATTKGKEKFESIINPTEENFPTLPTFPMPNFGELFSTKIEQSTTENKVSGEIKLVIDSPSGMDLTKLQEYLENDINMRLIANKLGPMIDEIRRYQETVTR